MRVKLNGGTIELSLEAEDLTGSIQYGHTIERGDGSHDMTINTPKLPDGATMHLEVPLTPSAMRALGKQVKWWASVAKKIDKALINGEHGG